jgi:hypothetical protein
MENTNSGNNAELPRYQSHKIVHALKIKSIEFFHHTNDGESGVWITPEDAYYGQFKAPWHSMFGKVEDILKNEKRPAPGWYYVVYDDGYVSYSPEKAFEEGYTKL